MADARKRLQLMSKLDELFHLPKSIKVGEVYSQYLISDAQMREYVICATLDGGKRVAIFMAGNENKFFYELLEETITYLFRTGMIEKKGINNFEYVTENICVNRKSIHSSRPIKIGVEKTEERNWSELKPEFKAHISDQTKEDRGIKNPDKEIYWNKTLSLDKKKELHDSFISGSVRENIFNRLHEIGKSILPVETKKQEAVQTIFNDILLLKRNDLFLLKNQIEINKDGILNYLRQEKSLFQLDKPTFSDKSKNYTEIIKLLNDAIIRQDSAFSNNSVTNDYSTLRPSSY